MVRFCTYNARGLGNFTKRKQLFNLLKYKNIDVVFLQESHMIEDEVWLWRSQWGGEIISSCGSSNARGVLILTRRGLDIKFGESVKDLHGRYIISEVIIDQCEFIVCNIYAPNIDNPLFFKEVEAQLELYDNANIVYGGDFNFAVNPELDRKFSHHNNDKARDTFMEFAEEKELVDVWRAMNPNEKQFSCCRPNSDSTDWYKFS